ncbi:MAG: LysR family transcriptional regulator [Chlamydiota bacterium]
MQPLENSSQEQELIEASALKTMENSLKNLRIVDLELFISAARMRSLSKAALAHHLSQSGASAAVQRVEAAFHASLCTHERRQFRLTREGLSLLPKFEEVVRKVRDLISINSQPSIRLVTTHAIAAVAVPSLLSLGKIAFKHMRPDHAYKAILEMEADIALVLDNAAWKGVVSAEVGKGRFQIYAKNRETPLKPVLLPEDQMEVLFLQQHWLQVEGYTLPVKARIPSWSLIAQICSATDEVGFLPDFLAKTFDLHPVLWQQAPSPYRILALYREGEQALQERFRKIIGKLCSLFSER